MRVDDVAGNMCLCLPAMELTTTGMSGTRGRNGPRRSAECSNLIICGAVFKGLTRAPFQLQT